jgi:hypothetical protein
LFEEAQVAMAARLAPGEGRAGSPKVKALHHRPSRSSDRVRVIAGRRRFAYRRGRRLGYSTVVLIVRRRGIFERLVCVWVTVSVGGSGAERRGKRLWLCIMDVTRILIFTV